MAQNIRVGAFLLITLAMLGTLVFLVGRVESKFESKYDVKAEFQNVAGLNEGADVRVGGIRRGTVSHIRLPQRPDEKVMVAMSLNKDTFNVVKQDSIAAIKSEGLLGDKYVEVSFGSAQGAPLKSGALIASEPALDISDLVAKTNQLLDGARQTLQNLEGVTQNANEITAKVNEGKGTVGALINDKTMYRQATAGATSLQEDADALKHNFLLRGFFNRRGYENSADLTKYMISKLPSGSPQKAFQFDSEKTFDKPDSAKLKHQPSLNEAGKYLESEPFAMAVIAASTGMRGDSAKDRELSQARAFVVRDYLVKNFKLHDERIKTIGLGKNGESGDRVEILVYPKVEGPQPDKK
jgi:phospholipid/cholesterol/gamma-HCH transport system substrate-binding protein